MRIAQTLTSGILIRQDFRDSVRFVMFATGLEDWEYATYGGTAFVVSFRGKRLGITCRHVFKDFDWRRLVITEAKFGKKHIAGLKAIFLPSSPTKEAIDTDLLDVAVIEFDDDVDANFFTDPPYIIDANTAGMSREGDSLRVNGVLKDESEIDGPDVTPVFALLEFQDHGAASDDPTLRKAYAEFAKPAKFKSVTGISGSPVFNVTTGTLCGMAVRGGLVGQTCTLWYVDIVDIVQMLDGITTGRLEASYRKMLRRRLNDSAMKGAARSR